MEFVYDKMTPELETYFAHGKTIPSYEYLKDKDGKTIHEPTPESRAARKAWDEEHDRLKKNLPPGEPDGYHQAQKIWFCRDENQVGEPREHRSPDGKYRLVVTGHSTREGCWRYSKGRVWNVTEGTLIAEVCRNYGAFPFAWVVNHGVTGHDYLVCGEDYQGQTVIDLTTGDRVDHLPATAAEGFGFCWASIVPSPSGALLAVEGCYWACPYEVIIVDFSNPMRPPWLILARDDEETFAGWNDDESCRIGEKWEVVDIAGHPLNGKKENDCTLEELEEIEHYAAKHDLPVGPNGEDPGWREVYKTHTWTRPPVLEVLQKWLALIVPWAKNRGGLFGADDAAQFTRMWEQLSEDERTSLQADPKWGPYLADVFTWSGT